MKKLSFSITPVAFSQFFFRCPQQRWSLDLHQEEAQALQHLFTFPVAHPVYLNLRTLLWVPSPMCSVARSGQEGQSSEAWWWMEESPQPDLEQVPWLLVWEKWPNAAQISAGFFLLSSLQECNFRVSVNFKFFCGSFLTVRRIHVCTHWNLSLNCHPCLGDPCSFIRRPVTWLHAAPASLTLCREQPDSASTKVLTWGEPRCLMRSGAHLLRLGLQWHLGLWHKKRLMIITAVRTSEWQ